MPWNSQGSRRVLFRRKVGHRNPLLSLKAEKNGDLLQAQSTNRVPRPGHALPGRRMAGPRGAAAGSHCLRWPASSVYCPRPPPGSTLPRCSARTTTSWRCSTACWTACRSSPGPSVVAALIHKAVSAQLTCLFAAQSHVGQSRPGRPEPAYLSGQPAAGHPRQEGDTPMSNTVIRPRSSMSPDELCEELGDSSNPVEPVVAAERHPPRRPA